MKQFESGRSMVEMLGTLAIIGVLSIGGIAGYSYGMDKYRANQTIHDVMLRTVDLISQSIQNRQTLSLNEWEKEKTIYDFSNPTYGETGVIKFDVGATNKIPQAVCEHLFDGLITQAEQIDINSSLADSKNTCQEENTMTFYFKGNSTGTSTETCAPDCAECIDGMCYNDPGVLASTQCTQDSDCGECSVCLNNGYGFGCSYSAKDNQPCQNGAGRCKSGICNLEDCSQTKTCPDKNQICYNTDSYPPIFTCIPFNNIFGAKNITVNGKSIKMYYSKDAYGRIRLKSACEQMGLVLPSINDLIVNWDGNTENNHTPSDFLKAIYDAGFYNTWVSDDAPSNNGEYGYVVDYWANEIHITTNANRIATCFKPSDLP